MVRKIILSLLLIASVIALNVHAAPFRATFQLAGGTGTYTVTNVYNSASSGANFSAIIFGNSATGTATIAYISGTTTSAAGTKVITATDKTLMVTNMPPLFVGDKIRVTSNDTGTNTSAAVGEEF